MSTAKDTVTGWKQRDAQRERMSDNKPDKYHYHEVVDRAHMMSAMFTVAFYNPAVIAEPEVAQLVEKIASDISDLHKIACMKAGEFESQNTIEMRLERLEKLIAPKPETHIFGDLEVLHPYRWFKTTWHDAMDDERIPEGWHIPTKEELAELCKHPAFVALFVQHCGKNAWAWSSSEYNTLNAWCQRPSDGNQKVNYNSHAYWVAPCRRLSF